MARSRAQHNLSSRDSEQELNKSISWFKHGWDSSHLCPSVQDAWFLSYYVSSNSFWHREHGHLHLFCCLATVLLMTVNLTSGAEITAFWVAPDSITWLRRQSSSPALGDIYIAECVFFFLCVHIFPFCLLTMSVPTLLILSTTLHFVVTL